MDKLLEAAANNPFTAIAFGVVLAMIFAVRQFGIVMGAKSTPAPTRQAEVAAVIVDPTALNRLTDQVEAVNETFSELVDVGKDMAKNTAFLTTEINRFREELRIHREIRRAN
ncbi:MAG TPA: hypothetical protein VGN93_31095 [Shinella sp.]|jgi:hypothetical protein|uniref:hypothetical protein n=1 Tax=Shinella sp. TaxID=1870904 RepID=UPI002E0DE131|nr:hypothetical protein [Shinella sp.]